MKKVYLLAFALGAFAFSANAQLIDDDIESYSLGPLFEDHWSSWSGTAGPDNALVSDEYANSGTQSVFISGDLAQDALLLLGNQASGEWQLDFKMYIPGGKSGYFNFQGETEGGGAGNGGAGVFLSPNLVFNNVQSTSGSPGVGGAYGNVDDPDPIYTWTYPQDFWFDVSIIFNVDDITWTMTIDGTEIPTQPMDDTPVVGGIDFFSFDANNEYYIDDVVFGSTAGIQDFAADSFRMYPNPVKDVLNISTKTAVDNIEVYDVLGKRVLSAQPDVISPKINMSGLASGTYMVKVTIGNASKTVKIIK